MCKYNSNTIKKENLTFIYVKKYVKVLVFVSCSCIYELGFFSIIEIDFCNSNEFGMVIISPSFVFR